MLKTNQKEKMTQEIQIHKSLHHPNIVGFHSFFDDPHNVYIVLELCKKRSMMELHKRRKVVTDYECRYYIHQIVSGVKYLHDNRIIHRDLKLGNLFLNDDLHVKVKTYLSRKKIWILTEIFKNRLATLALQHASSMMASAKRLFVVHRII